MMNGDMSIPLFQHSVSPSAAAAGDADADGGAKAAPAATAFADMLLRELPDETGVRLAVDGEASQEARKTENTLSFPQGEAERPSPFSRIPLADHEKSGEAGQEETKEAASVPGTVELVVPVAAEAQVGPALTPETPGETVEHAVENLKNAAAGEAQPGPGTGAAATAPSTPGRLSPVTEDVNASHQGKPSLAVLQEGEGMDALTETLVSAQSGNMPPVDGRNLPPRQPALHAFMPAPIAQALDTLKTPVELSAAGLPLESTAAASALELSAPAPELPAPSEPAPVNALMRGLLHAGMGSESMKLAQGDTAATYSLNSPAGSDQWQAELGNRIRWLAGMKISTAELQLHPAELGAVEVRIVTEDERATVSFVTHNAQARELIEASLPRLRELLSGSGLALQHSEVSQQSTPQERGRTFAQALRLDEPEPAAPGQAGTPVPRAGSLSLVDQYV